MESSKSIRSRLDINYSQIDYTTIRMVRELIQDLIEYEFLKRSDEPGRKFGFRKGILKDNGNPVEDNTTLSIDDQCLNYPFCQDQPCTHNGSPCMNGGCIDGNDCQNTNRDYCIDNGEFCKDLNCGNSDLNCFDNSTTSGCVDENCENISSMHSSNCSDWENCVDATCNNGGAISVCTDQNACADKGCTNDRCFNIGRQVTDEEQCINTKCMRLTWRTYQDGNQECVDRFCDP
jgi:hypothetical protein